MLTFQKQQATTVNRGWFACELLWLEKQHCAPVSSRPFIAYRFFLSGSRATEASFAGDNKMAKVVLVVVSFLLITCFSPCFAMMTGGISSVDLSDKPTRNVTMKGLGIFLKNKNEKQAPNNHVYLAICGSLRASSQIVEGVLYRVAVRLASVDKEFSRPGCITKGSLRLAKGDEKFGCFEIWSRPWLDDREKKLNFIVKERDSRSYSSCLEVNRF